MFPQREEKLLRPLKGLPPAWYNYIGLVYTRRTQSGYGVRAIYIGSGVRTSVKRRRQVSVSEGGKGMAFWVFMLIMGLLIPLTMVGFGKLFLTRAPKNINMVFGYRTVMSMKNRDTWEFAHKMIGKLWLRCGLAMLPLSVIPFLFVIGKDASAVGRVGIIVIAIQMLPMLGTLFPVEAALKKNFDKNGVRRQIDR